MAFGAQRFKEFCEPHFLRFVSLLCLVAMSSVLCFLVFDDMDCVRLIAKHYEEVTHSEKHSKGAVSVIRQVVKTVWIVLFLMLATFAANLFARKKHSARKAVIGASVVTHLTSAVIATLLCPKLVSLVNLVSNFRSKANDEYSSYLGKSCYRRLCWAFALTAEVSLLLFCATIVALISAYLRSQPRMSKMTVERREVAMAV